MKKRKIKEVLKAITKMVGEDNAGLLLAVVADALCESVKGVAVRNIRTFEVKINDFFSKKLNFEVGKYEDEISTNE